MAIFNTSPAFCGLGKPTIKLEFDNNEALIDFQRRMQKKGAKAEEWQDIESVRETVPAMRGLNAPGDTYIVTDTRKNPRKDLKEISSLKKLNIKTLTEKELQKIQNDDPLLYEQIKSDSLKYKTTKPSLGRTSANSLLYNNNDIIDTQGFEPTYKILPSYDHFFKPAENETTFEGFGLDDTKALISEYCNKYWKDCQQLADHLKANTLIQSCFNLWHWLRYNIKYEFDRAGREEIRSPRRVWADRFRGVDCDCLSVFAWCVLKCMGYRPAFELAAFRNKDTFSHIYINCDGVIVDRVWFVFNQRPPLVTKTELFFVKEPNSLGNLF